MRNIIDAFSFMPRAGLEQHANSPLRRSCCIVLIAAAYASQMCSVCEFVDQKSRNGREFLCLSCLYATHADLNAGGFN